MWRFDVVTDADGKPSLQQMYVCLYSILVPDCVWLNTTEALNPDELSPHFRAQRECHGVVWQTPDLEAL